MDYMLDFYDLLDDLPDRIVSLSILKASEIEISMTSSEEEV